MIVQEHRTIGGRNFIYTISDSGRYIVRDGEKYVDAYDPADLGRVYTEGELLPDDYQIAAIEDKAEAYDILMGVS